MGSYGKALLLGLWAALVVGSVDNVLRAFVVGAREKQHPMLIALAAIGGTYAFGLLGILLGPLVVSLAAALLKEIQKLVSPSTVPATYPRDEGAALAKCWPGGVSDYLQELQMVKAAPLDVGGLAAAADHLEAARQFMPGIHCFSSNTFLMLIRFSSCAERVLPTMILLRSEPLNPVRPCCVELFKLMR